MDANRITKIENEILDYCALKLKTLENPLLTIVGPTGSGKTALSLKLAKKFNGEIISADSRQIYRHMDIGTDKIPFEKRLDIPHHLLDIVDPDSRFTVADFKRLAESTIDEILSRGHLPILVGGTGLYIRAITQNFSICPEDKKIRNNLMKELNEKGKEYLHEKLSKLDPESASKIHRNNVPYVVRALEIYYATGKPKKANKEKSKYDILQIGLVWPKEILFDRINRRVDDQIARGLIDETKKLLQMGYPKDLPAMSSLGYQEIIDYLEGKIPLEEATDLIKKNTRAYAKRQMTWFKKDEGIVWYNLANVDSGKSLAN